MELERGLPQLLREAMRLRRIEMATMAVRMQTTGVQGRLTKNGHRYITSIELSLDKKHCSVL